MSRRTAICRRRSTTPSRAIAITLAPGATYRGNFQLRRKDGNGWIVIAIGGRSDLPPPGTRVNPSDASKMPKIVADSGYWVFKAEPGAHHYRLVGLEIAPADGKSLTNLVELGGGDERGVEALPHHIIIERCYLHGDRKEGARRGVSLNARARRRGRLLLVGFQGAHDRRAGDRRDGTVRARS